MRMLLICCAAAALLASPAAFAQDGSDQTTERAERNPLGSRGKPVRANGPLGQRAYLSRLRCADGTPPEFERSGSVGRGSGAHYDHMIDRYVVRCAGQDAVSVYMDLYHARSERRSISGFTIAD